MSPAVPRDVVVVTGAGAMGLAVARRLAAGRPVLLADASESTLDIGVAALRGEGHAVAGHLVDVSDAGSVQKLAADAAALGRVAAVVHTAGVSPVTAGARLIYEVDLLGTAHVIDAFLDVAAPGTALVCVASMAGHLASLSTDLERHLATAPTDRLLDHPEIDLEAADGTGAYLTAKRGNHLRVQAGAAAWGRQGARLNTLSPGVTATPMGLRELHGPTGAYIQAMIDASGAARVGTPADIAAVAAFLTGPDSAFVTGNDILVDGGTIAAQRWSGS
jgi:NAD(P)-dependent dehydrogenase (short-subunit alcohol dehydrogenase family)